MKTFIHFCNVHFGCLQDIVNGLLLKAEVCCRERPSAGRVGDKGTGGSSVGGPGTLSGKGLTEDQLAPAGEEKSGGMEGHVNSLSACLNTDKRIKQHH